MLQAIKRTVLVEPITESAATESGLILQSSDQATSARIVAVGPQCNCGLAVGDRVLIDWARVGRIDHEDRIYYVVDQANVMAVFLD